MERHESVSVFGVFRSRSQVDAAVLSLRRKKIDITSISMILPAPPEEFISSENNSFTFSGALGILIAQSIYSVGGATPVIVAGPLLDVISDFGPEKELKGFIDPFVAIGMDPMDARRLDRRIRQGLTVLSVEAGPSNRPDAIGPILEDSGASEIIITKGPDASLSLFEKSFYTHRRGPDKDPT